MMNEQIVSSPESRNEAEGGRGKRYSDRIRAPKANWLMLPVQIVQMAGGISGEDWWIKVEAGRIELELFRDLEERQAEWKIVTTHSQNGLRLPKEFTEVFEIKQGTSFTYEMQGERIVIQPADCDKWPSGQSELINEA